MLFCRLLRIALVLSSIFGGEVVCNRVGVSSCKGHGVDWIKFSLRRSYFDYRFCLFVWILAEIDFKFYYFVLVSFCGLIWCCFQSRTLFVFFWFFDLDWEWFLFPFDFLISFKNGFRLVIMIDFKLTFVLGWEYFCLLKKIIFSFDLSIAFVIVFKPEEY